VGLGLVGLLSAVGDVRCLLLEHLLKLFECAELSDLGVDRKSELLSLRVCDDESLLACLLARDRIKIAARRRLLCSYKLL